MRLLSTVLLSAVMAGPAFAQRGPVLVVPGRPDVPVYINGIDASWGIVGEFGLDRPNMVAPVVTWRPPLYQVPYHVPGYFPSDGRRPGYGRLEVLPPHRPPHPGPYYFRSWSSSSEPLPATEYPATLPHAGQSYQSPQIYPSAQEPSLPSEAAPTMDSHRSRQAGMRGDPRRAGAHRSQ